MYLVPRLIGVFAYAALTFLCMWLIKRTNARVKTVLNFALVSLSLMGFFFVPNEDADLTRLLPIMHSYSSLPFSEIISVAKTYSTPGEPIYYWLIGQLGVDGALPAITAFLTYGFCFSVLRDCEYTFDSYRSDIALVFFVFMSRGLLVHVISGIRNELSFAIILWCLWKELFKEKSVVRHIPLYIIAASLHAMGQFFLIYRIIFLLFEKGKTNFSKLQKFFIGCCAVVAVMVYGSRFLTSLSTKASNYYNRAILGTGYSYFWEGLLSAIAVFISAVLIFWLYRCIKTGIADSAENCLGIKNLVSFSAPILIIDALAVFIEFSFFHRTSNMLTMLDIPLAFILLRMPLDVKVSQNLRRTLYYVSVCCLFIACARGNLCSLKFFV